MTTRGVPGLESKAETKNKMNYVQTAKQVVLSIITKLSAETPEDRSYVTTYRGYKLVLVLRYGGAPYVEVYDKGDNKLGL